MKKGLAMLALVASASWTAFAQADPKVGAYLGYEYVRFNPSGNASSFSANGGDGQFVYNFNRWIGGVVDAGAVHNNNNNGIHADTTVANFLVGPRVTLGGHHARFKPYFQVLWGGAYATSSVQVIGIPTNPIFPGGLLPVIPGQAITARVVASQTAFAMVAGGGLDIRLSHHVSFRPIQVDYYLTRFHNFPTQSDNNQNNVRYSGGFAFWFGGEKPAPQAHRMAQKTCPDGSIVELNAPCPKHGFSMSLSATPSELCPGEVAHLMPSFSGASGAQLNYSTWFVNGEKVADTGNYDFQSEGRAPGTYTVKLTAGGQNFNPASAETTITVREYLPPTGTVQANPATIRAGEKSTISSSFNGQCGGPIQPATYEASEGTIQGDQFDSSTIQWDASNSAEQRKAVTITAKAADSKSVGSATTTVEIVRPSVITPVRLPDVLFPENNSRVNNCGKRILLEQLRSYYERDSGGTVVLVGHSSGDETAPNLAQQRVMNAAAVITAGTGVCLSIPATQVQVSAPGVDQNGVSFESGFCQNSIRPTGPSTEMRRVEVWFVPAGGQIPPSVTNSQNATMLPVSSLGCPK